MPSCPSLNPRHSRRSALADALRVSREPLRLLATHEHGVGNENDMKPKHGPDKHKHLEMIQGVVNRLASNSFSIKQWTVVLVSALFVLVAREGSVPIWVALVPVSAFWGLDGYFLWQERRFRNLYVDVCETDEGEITFSMNAGCKNNSYWRAAFSVTLLSFYGLFVALVVATSFFF